MNNPLFPSPEELLEKGKSAVQKQVQATVHQTNSQITGNAPSADSSQAHTLNDQLNRDFIRDMYQPTSLSKPHMQSAQAQSQGTGSTTDQQVLEQRRKELQLLQKQHKESYFIPTFEKRPGQEERPAEKVEREENEEKQKRWELQQKEKKQPIALTMAKNKSEQFPGASG